VKGFQPSLAQVFVKAALSENCEGSVSPERIYDMRNAIIAVCTSLLLCSCASAQDSATSQVLLKHYRGKEAIPADLYEAYAGLVSAIETGEQGNIQKYCLPHCVTFTTEERPEMREYGQDMNIPFLKKGFISAIETVRKDSNDVWLLRTGSSYLFFVRTKSMGWKLYKYGDKPIE